jgi:hypothetical protein
MRDLGSPEPTASSSPPSEEESSTEDEKHPATVESEGPKSTKSKTKTKKSPYDSSLTKALFQTYRVPFCVGGLFLALAGMS